MIDSSHCFSYLASFLPPPADLHLPHNVRFIFFIFVAYKSALSGTETCVVFGFRVPGRELQVRREQQTQEGEDGVHQGADPRAGGRVRPPQLPNQTKALRDRRQPRPH